MAELSLPIERQSIVRLEDVPLDQRYCNNCDRQITDEGNIGDVWWVAGPAETAMLLCRSCA